MSLISMYYLDIQTMQQFMILDNQAVWVVNYSVIQIHSQLKLREQIERAKDIDHLFVKYKLIKQGQQLSLIRIVDESFISLRAYLQDNNRNPKWMEILMKLTDIIYWVILAKVPFQVINIDKIFINSTNQQQILLDTPQFRALLPINFTLEQINRIPTFLSQLTEVFLQVITWNVVIKDINLAIRNMQDGEVKKILRWMMETPRWREQPHLDRRLQQLYEFLEDVKNKKQRKKKQLFPMFSVDLFDPSYKPKFYINHPQYDIQIDQDTKFRANYQSTEQKLIIWLQHIETQETYLIQLHQKDLPQLFKHQDVYQNTRQLWRQIKQDMDKRIEVTSAGQFILKTSINWNQYQTISKIYQTVDRIEHRPRGFNQSRLFGDLFSAYRNKDRPIPPRLEKFIQNQLIFILQFAKDLFRHHKFIERASVLQWIIERQKQNNYEFSDYFIVNN